MSGKFYALVEHSENVQQSESTISILSTADSPTLSHVAIAGNGKTSIIMLQARGSRMIHILEFSSYANFKAWFSNPSGNTGSVSAWTHHMLPGRAKTLLSGTTCFLLLTDEGQVFSWGDGRWPQCLGRVPDAENPADKPCLVAALGGVGIAKIDGVGWAFGALSQEGDLYLWGVDVPGTEEQMLGPLLGGSGEEVKLLEGGDDQKFDDIADYTMGSGHLLVAPSKGRAVWGFGQIRNGQLGVEGAAVKEWQKVLDVEHVDGLVSGSSSSFVISAGEIG